MSNIFSFNGTVGRDAEVKYTGAGMAVLSVTVANNIGYGDKQKTLWIRCALFGKRAEGQLVTYLKKGQSVFVSGELSQSEYKANDGSTKTSLELACTILELVGGKRGSDFSHENPSAPAQTREQAPPAQTNYGDNFDDSDIPF